MKFRYLPFLSVAILCLFIGIAMTARPQPEARSAMLGKPFPQLMLHGQEVKALAQGKPVMVNLFASWCVPCRAEHKVLLKAKERFDIPIIGIAWRDSEDKAVALLEENGNPYAALLVDEEGASTLPLGMTGVPETFVIDAEGRIVYHLQEPLTMARFTQEILPLFEGGAR